MAALEAERWLAAHEGAPAPRAKKRAKPRKAGKPARAAKKKAKKPAKRK
jgi:hypothetical protein